VLSNHDVVRHPTRYGGGPVGLARARAATLAMLALPGSAYLYQGEELGLHEVGDLPEEVLQDPTFRRSGGAEKGRDGCRVPLPWTVDGPSFGFGEGGAHLPQPAWFGRCSVQAEEEDDASTLQMYREALALRRKLQTAEEMERVETGTTSVLHFVRPGGWQSVTNFGEVPVHLPRGEVVIASGPLSDGMLPPDTTAWLV
jgi:alpha-glucosidase